MPAVAADRVAAVRGFNRFYTNVIGVLREGLLDSPYSLTEARVIFELAQRDSMELVELRRLLDIDAGYLTRILARFESAGLIAKERSPHDARRQVIRLRRTGRAAFRALDRRSARRVRSLLEPLTDEEQRRLLGAMGSVQDILGDPPPEERLVTRRPRAGDYGWVIARHGALYSEEYGWDESFEALVARIVADYMEGHDAARERAWIAELDGEPVGCVFCVKKDERSAKLRLLLVETRARGRGIGTRLVDECLCFARNAGYQRVTLWTNDVLDDARRIYERAGFELTASEAHRSFGHDLVGQDWEREL
jgi:DNA-binding MarR family transcriptional regulator/N-acetylglutamate synthase-like GNAT family acetyltransferase